jgi:hypothetical protein
MSTSDLFLQRSCECKCRHRFDQLVTPMYPRCILIPLYNHYQYLISATCFLCIGALTAESSERTTTRHQNTIPRRFEKCGWGTDSLHQIRSHLIEWLPFSVNDNSMAKHRRSRCVHLWIYPGFDPWWRRTPSRDRRACTISNRRGCL